MSEKKTKLDDQFLNTTIESITNVIHKLGFSIAMYLENEIHSEGTCHICETMTTEGLINLKATIDECLNEREIERKTKMN